MIIILTTKSRIDNLIGYKNTDTREKEREQNL